MMEKDPLTGRVIGCAIEVHRELGPGLLESTYEKCLAYEMTVANIPYRVQVDLPVKYKGMNIDCGYRIDMLVDERLILELKSVETLQPIHEAQLLTYLKLSGIKTGLLMNFNVKRLINGIKRFKL